MKAINREIEVELELEMEVNGEECMCGERESQPEPWAQKLIDLRQWHLSVPQLDAEG